MIFFFYFDKKIQIFKIFSKNVMQKFYKFLKYQIYSIKIAVSKLQFLISVLEARAENGKAIS